MQRTQIEHQTAHRQRAADEPAGLMGLSALLSGAFILAAILWTLGGPPQWPAILLDPDALATALTSTAVADAELIATVTAVGWLVLGYLAVSVVLRTAAVAAARATDGAHWARTALTLTNLITVPAVRRVVDGGVAGTLLAASWMPTAGRAVAVAPEPSVSIVAVVAAGPGSSHSGHVQEQATRTQFVRYTVAPGDDLWSIARRIYGDGSRFMTLLEANHDRVMSDGARFTDPRVIRAGWVLLAPLPARHVDASAEAVTYRVSRGDHLWGIAERFLGDGFRWTELWEANRDREMGDGRRFVDPNLIHPGWSLDLPLEVTTDMSPTTEPPAQSQPVEPSAGAGASPSPEPEVVDPGATGDEATVEADGDGLTWDWPEVPRAVSVSAAGFVVLGAAAVFVQRLRRAGLLAVPPLFGRRAPRPGDAGRVTLVTRAVLGALREHGVEDARVLRVDESAEELTLSIASSHSGEAVLAGASAASALLGCVVEAHVIGRDRVDLSVIRPGRAALALGGQNDEVPSLDVPVGVEASGAVTYLDLAGLGSAALACHASEARRLLHDWLATLATTNAPDRLVFRGDEAMTSLLGADAALPHFGGVTTGPEAADLVDELLELVRSRDEAGHLAPAVIAVMDVSTAASWAGVDRLLAEGPAVGVYLVGVLAPDASMPSGFGAQLRFEAASDVADDDSAAGEQIEFVMASGERVLLDPVLVRRDTSNRWREHATAVSDRGGSSGPAEDGGTEPPPDDAPDRQRPGPGGGFDWHRAIFEEETPSAALTDEAEARTSATAEVPHPEGDQLGPAAPDVEPVAEPVGRDEPAPAAATDPARSPDAEAEPAVIGAAPLAMPSGAAVRQGALFVDTDERQTQAGASSTEGLVRVTCFGGLRVEAAGVDVTSWPYDKGRELLALLVAHGGAALPRQAAAESLWPDYDWDASVKHMMSNAATSLRTAMRTASGQKDLQVLVLGQGRYSLQPGMVRSDLDDLEAGLRRAASLPDEEALSEYEEALALYRGPFLAYEPFAWAEAYQREYVRRFVEGAIQAGDAAHRAAAFERAADFYRRALEQEPAEEEAARGVMRSLGALGDPNGVRKVYRVLAEALQEELDEPRAAPSPETQALYTELTRRTAVG